MATETNLMGHFARCNDVRFCAQISTFNQFRPSFIDEI